MSLSTTNLFSGSSPVIQFDWEFKPTSYQIDCYNKFFKNNINLSHRSGAEEQKKENIPPMETKTVTKSYRIKRSDFSEYEMDVQFVGTDYDSNRVTFRGQHGGELSDLFEDSKVGDEFLFIVIKQPKAEK